MGHDTTLIMKNTPQGLRVLPQWLVWLKEEVKGRLTKVPYDAKTGRKASSTDPATWATFDAALAACQADSFAGVGFVFASDGDFCGVDLDDSIDPATSALKPWARAIVEQLNSYTEISPSGTGVKIFLRAKKPGTRCRKAYEDGDVEMYDSARFFTVTGWRLPDFSADVESRSVFGDEGQAAPVAPSPPSALPTAPPVYLGPTPKSSRKPSAAVVAAKSSRPSGAASGTTTSTPPAKRTCRSVAPWPFTPKTPRRSTAFSASPGSCAPSGTSRGARAPTAATPSARPCPR
jgi:hypothetical protein